MAQGIAPHPVDTEAKVQRGFSRSFPRGSRKAR